MDSRHALRIGIIGEMPTVRGSEHVRRIYGNFKVVLGFRKLLVDREYSVLHRSLFFLAMVIGDKRSMKHHVLD